MGLPPHNANEINIASAIRDLARVLSPLPGSIVTPAHYPTPKFIRAAYCSESTDASDQEAQSALPIMTNAML